MVSIQRETIGNLNGIMMMYGGKIDSKFKGFKLNSEI